MTGQIHQSRIDGNIVLLELDNPPMNALGPAMLRQAEDALHQIEHDTSVRALVLTGRGRAFCSGADLKAFAADGPEHAARDIEHFNRVLELVARCRAPTIAAVNGHCLGGGFELALCCDLRIASTEAKFVCAGVNVGLMASTYRLPRLIGLSRAKTMLLTGAAHDAATALAWGLVTELQAPEELLPAALHLARRVASRAPLSVEASKRVADRALDLSPAEADELIAREMAVLRASHDHQEALSAFLAKREPVFGRR